MKKIYISESKLYLLKENEEKREVTFQEFFINAKSFLKDLLTKPAEAEPSDLFSKNGITKKDLLTKMKDLELLRSKENITEVPVEEGSDKKRAKHTIQYLVPKKNFKDKMHKLHKDLFESKSVFSNENEEIEKILNMDNDNAYKNRGGYKITEKKFIPLKYNNCGSAFYQINNLFENCEDHRLLEGLIKSYPIEQVIKSFVITYGFTDNWKEYINDVDGFNGFITTVNCENGETILNFVFKNDKRNVINMIKKPLALCGYDLSSQYYWNEDEFGDMFICVESEKKHQNTINEVVKEKGKIFHLTRKDLLNKIMTNGLEPRHNDKKSHHDDRIFFMLENLSNFGWKYLASDLYHNTRGEYVILEIDTKDLDVNFYYDPNMKNGVYTKENIHPKYITNIKEIDL